MMMGKEVFSRRRLLKTAAQVGAIGVAPRIIPASALGRGGAVAPSDRVTLGGLGIGGRGTSVLKSFLLQPDIQFLAKNGQIRVLNWRGYVDPER